MSGRGFLAETKFSELSVSVEDNRKPELPSSSQEESWATPAEVAGCALTSEPAHPASLPRSAHSISSNPRPQPSENQHVKLKKNLKALALAANQSADSCVEMKVSEHK